MSWMPDLRSFSNYSIHLMGAAPSFGSAPTLSAAIQHLVAQAFQGRDPAWLARICDEAGGAKKRDECMESLMDGFQSGDSMAVFGAALSEVETFEGLAIMCGAYRRALRGRSREAWGDEVTARRLPPEECAPAVRALGDEVEAMTRALCQAWVRLDKGVGAELGASEAAARHLAVLEATCSISVALDKGDMGSGSERASDGSLLARHMSGIQQVPEKDWERIWEERSASADRWSGGCARFEAWLEAREVSTAVASHPAFSGPGKRGRSL